MSDYRHCDRKGCEEKWFRGTLAPHDEDRHVVLVYGSHDERHHFCDRDCLIQWALMKKCEIAGRRHQIIDPAYQRTIDQIERDRDIQRQPLNETAS